MIPGPILAVGKLFPKRYRSMAYVAWSSIGGVLRGREISLGSESGVAATRRTFWSSRAQVTNGELKPWSFPALADSELPEIDISVVTYNSAEVINALLESIAKSRYPIEKLHLRVTDNSSSDDTVNLVRARQSDLATKFASFDIQVAPNEGFGAGHNRGIDRGSGQFVLVVNPDLQLHPDCLRQLVTRATQSPSDWVAFEPRQFPYEHPKVYDPITHEVAWNSHACLLIRRSAFESVSGYDESIFLYGEDVEISYRLRSAGFRLAYVPAARTEHDALDSPTRSSALQFRGGISSNVLIRLRYGDQFARLAAPLKLAGLLRNREHAEHRKFFLRQLRDLPGLAKANPINANIPVGFPINSWNFELQRDGHDVHLGSAFDEFPTDMVSIVTRTIARYSTDLIETMATVANQTYPHLEHVIVFDGIDEVPEDVREFALTLPHPVRFEVLSKVGRSAAGNAGLRAANGSLLMFLDDDDLLFADHVEVLVRALHGVPRAAAAYSRAFEVTADRVGNRLGAEKSIEVPHLHRQSFDFPTLLHHNYMAIQSVLFRRTMFEERGGLREDLELLEDWNMWIRFAYKQHFIEVQKVTSMYRVVAATTQNERRRRSLADSYLRVRAENDLDLIALERQLNGSQETGPKQPLGP
jgi:GT2 family glycosyltransferase